MSGTKFGGLTLGTILGEPYPYSTQIKEKTVHCLLFPLVPQGLHTKRGKATQIQSIHY